MKRITWIGKSVAALVFVSPLLAQALTPVRPADTIKVRSGPGTSYAQIGLVPAGNVYVAVEKPSGWWKIYFNGGFGYTNASYYSSLGSAPGAKVTTATLYVRSGPSTSYTVIGRVYLGQTYALAQTGVVNGMWRKIYWGGRIAYISTYYSTAVTVSASSSTSTSTSTSTGSLGLTNLSMTHYYQPNSYWCGPATAQMVIRKVSGKYVYQSTLARYMGTTRSGTGPYQVASGIRAYSGAGYRVVSLSTVNLRSLTIYHINRNKPVPANFATRYISYFRNWFYHHSPIKGYTSGGYYIHDSAKGPNRWASNTEMYNAIRYNNNVYTRLY